ncbi:type II toxin-antitoxin system RelE/ParE family toxin [Candidatus Gottesmanbacteria bacterium]|nr:type II toxin-antitoxin system RelE/ParE family toxin [Candidatus Gottesmanbacteria bacterium]MBI3443745.1 type II toxin-antitoxin system RelE/ParE family toxin [Candidatus Woesebacteria bacterium]
MPAKNFIVSKRVKKKIIQLPPSVKKRLPLILLEIKQNPIFGAKLHGDLEDFYKIRIGDYRIIYTFDVKSSTVEVLRIEHRQGVYK